MMRLVWDVGGLRDTSVGLADVRYIVSIVRFSDWYERGTGYLQFMMVRRLVRWGEFCTTRSVEFDAAAPCGPGDVGV
jgi:hypothetical protein